MDYSQFDYKDPIEGVIYWRIGPGAKVYPYYEGERNVIIDPNASAGDLTVSSGIPVFNDYAGFRNTFQVSADCTSLIALPYGVAEESGDEEWIPLGLCVRIVEKMPRI